MRYFVIDFAFQKLHGSVAVAFILFGLHNVMRILFILFFFCSQSGGSLDIIKNRVKRAEALRLSKIKDFPSLSHEDVQTLKSLCCDYKSLI